MSVDLRPLLEPDRRADSIVILGVRVGDDIEDLDVAACEQLDGPRDGGASADEGTVYERLERARREGGPMSVGGVVLVVKNNLVSKFIVHGGRSPDSCAVLGVQREEDIDRLFGAADHVQRSSERWITHTFVDRQLVVAFDRDAGAISRVELGKVDWAPKGYGARHLLNELLGAASRLERDDWETEGDGYAQYHFRRVAALASALGLGSPRDVAKGRFIRGDHPRYSEILAEMAAKSERPDGAVMHGSTQVIFEELLRYCAQVRGAAGVTPPMECSCAAISGAITAQLEVSGRIREALAPLEAWLVRILDPDGRLVDERELIEKHGWPTENPYDDYGESI